MTLKPAVDALARAVGAGATGTDAIVQGMHVSVGIGAIVVAARAAFVALSLREVPASGQPEGETALATEAAAS